MINLIKNELYKAFRLKKLYLFMLIITVIEISTVLQYKLRGPEFIYITPNGQSFPLALLRGLPQIMIIFIAVFLAEIICDEYKNGTLKLTLLHPVDRTQLLHSKVVSLLVFTAAILGFTVISSYLVGTVAFGWGEQTLYEGMAYTTEEGILLTLQSVLLSLLPYMGFGMVVVFIAIASANMSTTVGISLGLMLVSPFVDHAEKLRNYSIVYQMYAFHQNFIAGLIWKDIFLGIISIAAYIILFYLSSVKVLKKKDLLF